MFLDLIDKLILGMFATDVFPCNLINECYKLMASKNCKHLLFTEEFLSKLVTCKSLFLFKIYLLPYMTWFDHSILEELVSATKSSEAEQLVEQFKSMIDDDQLVKFSFIPAPSQLIIPLVDNDYTLVITKCTWINENTTLKNIKDIRDTLVSTWGITYHALQLNSINANYLFWMIPNCVVSLIEMAVCNPEMQHKLWLKGVTSTVIFPIDFFANDCNVSTDYDMGPFEFLNSHDDTMVCLYCMYVHKRTK